MTISSFLAEDLARQHIDDLRSEAAHLRIVRRGRRAGLGGTQKRTDDARWFRRRR